MTAHIWSPQLWELYPTITDLEQFTWCDIPRKLDWSSFQLSRPAGHYVFVLVKDYSINVWRRCGHCGDFRTGHVGNQCLFRPTYYAETLLFDASEYLSNLEPLFLEPPMTARLPRVSDVLPGELVPIPFELDWARFQLRDRQTFYSLVAYLPPVAKARAMGYERPRELHLIISCQHCRHPLSFFHTGPLQQCRLQSTYYKEDLFVWSETPMRDLELLRAQR